MTKDQALKLALEALQHEEDTGNDDAYKLERDAIKEALAQPEQEPVAWIYSQGTAKVASMSYVSGVRATPLYTSPPAQRTWVGLTEDEAFACQGRDYFETYKAIEAKLKEKNT